MSDIAEEEAADDSWDDERDPAVRSVLPPTVAKTTDHSFTPSFEDNNNATSSHGFLRIKSVQLLLDPKILSAIDIALEKDFITSVETEPAPLTVEESISEYVNRLSKEQVVNINKPEAVATTSAHPGASAAAGVASLQTAGAIPATLTSVLAAESAGEGAAERPAASPGPPCSLSPTVITKV
jgi:hypothetical protein